MIELENQKGFISDTQAEEAVTEFFEQNGYSAKKILLIVPDNTRSGPVGRIFQMIFDRIGSDAAALDVLVALGTHQPLTEEQICERLSITLQQRKQKYSSVKFFNHEWEKSETFKSIGKITAEQISEITDGLFAKEVDVSINKLIFEYDEFFIIGPVFPHEVVGFSGGHKYIFPGIASEEIINFFHWLGALITNQQINGNKWTATRRVVEQAASLVNIDGKLFSIVAVNNQLKGLFIGQVQQAWERAADLSGLVHIVYKDKPYKTVLGIAPEMYEDIWTAGKVMYKLESVVADGGTLIIYAPHIDEVSYTHGRILDKIGYHTKDFFLEQWDKFKHLPHGVIAHSTHVKGIGSYEDGIERPRINVVLATAISQLRCEKLNLGYMNPDNINITDFRSKEDDGILVVEHAGEILYRLRGSNA